MKQIILASSSPVRQELFKKLGLEFSVEPSSFNEHTIAIADPKELVKALALAKAKTVAERTRNAVVVGADTVVAYGNEIFGKPRDHEHAKAMLQKLSGSSHSVFTGFAIYDADLDRFILDAVETKLSFLPLSEAEIEAYVKSGEPFGKAGGYAIQGLAGFFVRHIDGDYFNVLGLPLSALAERLSEFGVPCSFSSEEA